MSNGDMMDLTGVMDKIAATAEEAIKAVEDDYIGTDGLLYCGSCKTRKQTRVEYEGKVKIHMCLCDCETKKRDLQQFSDRVSRLRQNGFPDAAMQKYTFEADDGQNERISGIAKQYVDNFEYMLSHGKGLIFFGGVGTGKTFIASCIANALIDKGYSCLVTSFARLVNTIQDMREGKQDYIDSLNQFSLLVIDDLAAERDTDYMQEIVTSIIDSRCRSGKPLIVTTNLTAEEIKYPAEIRKQRIYSRLLEVCMPIEVEGEDRRKEKLKTDVSEMKNLLGL